MFPILFQKGPWIIYTFSTMFLLASLTATFYAYFLASRKNLSPLVVLDLGFIGTLSAILGGRLFHAAVEAPQYYAQFPMEILKIWKGGIVSYGAVLGITLSFYLYLKIRKLEMWKYADLMALVGPIIIFFVRIGCLSQGCCYGKPTHFLIHLTFTNRLSDAAHYHDGVPLHATQIYDLFFNGIFLFFILHWIDKRKKFDGQVIAWFFILYGFMRGMVEFLRGDIDRGVYGGGVISTAQIMGIFSIGFGVYLYYYCRALARKKGMHASLPHPN